MRFRIIFITIIFSFFTQFLDAKDSRYVNREYVLKGFAYSSNEDTIDRVYPGDKIEVLYIEENFAPTNKQEQYWAKVKLSNGKEGFIPEAFLQNKKPKIKGMIHRALFRAPEYFVTVSVLNARSKPSLNGAILFALNRGDVVQVLQFSEKDELIGGISAKWAYVQKGTDKAWVFSGYLSLKKEETVEEKKDTDYNPKEGETKYIRLSELDLYEFPTTFSDKKGKLKENTAVKIEKINHRKETLEGIQSYWVKVRAEKGGQDGWVFAGYLKNKTEEKKPEPTKEEKEEKEEKKTTFSLPLKKGDFNISSSYGPRKIFGKNGFHNGLDMYAFARVGTPIYAAGNGKVIVSKRWGNYGNFIAIQHENGLVTYYAHQSVLIKKEGEKVKQGELIGKVGNTGKSTGPHLHFEVRDGLGKKHFNPVNYLPGF